VGPWDTNPRQKHWWNKDKATDDFVRGFVLDVSDQKYSERRYRNLFRTKFGKWLREQVRPIVDDVQGRPEILKEVLLYDVNPYMAGMALSLAFLKEDFAFVQDFGPDKVEVWPAEMQVIGKGDYEGCLQFYLDRFNNEPTRQFLSHMDKDEKSDVYSDIWSLCTSNLGNFSEGDVIVDPQYDMKFKQARDGTVESVVRRQKIFRKRVAASKAKGRKVYSRRAVLRWREVIRQAHWKDLGLLFHADDLPPPP
jgi:hypothetical protein